LPPANGFGPPAREPCGISIGVSLLQSARER
jgi:hypothetical protein